MKKNNAVIRKALRHSPISAYHLANGFLGMQKARHLDYRLKRTKGRQLKLVTFKITPLCNLRCVMCGQRGEKGILKDDLALEENKKIIDIDTYKKLIDDIAPKKPIVYIWGGEPMLYPNFMDLAAYFKKKLPFFSVNTNGTLLKKHAERIVADKWTSLFISLDSFEDVNDQIRGKGSFAKVMEGIEAINREKARQKSTFPLIGIVTTITNLNYMYLDKMTESVSKMGLAWHIINLGTYVNEEIGQRHTAYMKEKLDIDAVSWKGFTSGYNEGIDGEAFSHILNKVQRMDPGYPIITVPVIDHRVIGKYYSDLDMIVRNKCYYPWFGCDINYNGDVHFCADYPEYVIGNIKDNRLIDIYNGEKAERFRRELIDSPEGLFPACKRCYQNMLAGNRVK